MLPAIPWRRFRFSLKTLFFVLAIGCGWLGWTMNQVHQRNALLDLMLSRNSMFDADAEQYRQISLYSVRWDIVQSGRRLPWAWQCVGVRPIHSINIFRRTFSPAEIAQIKRFFPEAEIAAVYFPAEEP